MRTRLFYLAHPLGQPPERERNVQRALRWFAYLLRRYPDRAILAPWLPYVSVLGESPPERERGIRDDLAALERCDGIILCGGRLSEGMREELEIANQLGLKVETLLSLGREPPEKAEPPPRRGL